MIRPILGLGTISHKQRTFRPFLAIFGPFHGHIEELEGKKGFMVIGQSRRMCIVASVSLRLADLTVFWGHFGPEKALSRHKMRHFSKAPSDLAPPHRAPAVSFRLKIWI